MSQYWISVAVWASPSYSELMQPKKIQMVILVHFVKTRHISRLHYQECIRCPPPPQFSARTQPLGRTYKASALWWKIYPWYIKSWRRPGFTKGRVQDTQWDAIAPHLVYPRSRPTQHLLRSRSIKLLFFFGSLQGLQPLTFTDAGQTTRKFCCLSQDSWTTQSNAPTNYYTDKGSVLAERWETLVIGYVL